MTPTNDTDLVSTNTTYQILYYEANSDSECDTIDRSSESQALLGSSDQSYSTRYMAASPIPPTQPHDDQKPRDKWTLFKVRCKYYLPILQWLPLYNFNLFFGDLFAGLTVSCLLIPTGLSYATALCKLDAIHGLYGIAFPAVTYAIFGMSRQMSVGPEAALCLLLGSSIAQQQHMKDYQIDPLAWSCLMTLFVGLFTFLLGICRLGFLDSLMSRALLRGFITGVALVVMVQQSIALLGLVERSKKMGLTEASTSLERIFFLCSNIQYTHPLSAMVSATSLVFLLSVRIIKSKWGQKSRWIQLLPESLFMVITAVLLTGYFRWDLQGLQILGNIKNSGIPAPSLPTFPPSKHLKDIIITAAMISIIGFVESIVISKTYSSRHNYSVSANRELVALGIANIASALFQGIPAYGSVARSKINDRAGAGTQMAGLISGIVALMAILFLLPYLYYLPKTVLSSIIFVAVLSLLSELPEDLHFIFKIGAWRDLALLLVTFTATMIISLEFGTLLAVTLSLILTIRETSYPRISIMGRVKGTTDKFKPIQGDPHTIEHLEDVLIIRIEEPLFFANTGQLKDRLRRLEIFGDMSIHPSESPRLQESSFTIFDVGSMPYIDASAVQILMEVVSAYHARQVSVYFVRLRSAPLATFEKSGLLDLIGRDHIFRKVSDAIESIEREINA